MIYVAFDFDETLGHFSQLSQIIYMIQRNSKMPEYNPRIIASLLSSIPMQKYIRPGIINLLKELVILRRKNICKLVIYTNNSGGKRWVNDVINGFSIIIGIPKLFDNIIYEYRVNQCRTTWEKTYIDFLACVDGKYTDHTIFIDDAYHPKMNTQFVTYIKISPYIYHLSHYDLKKFFDSYGLKINLEQIDNHRTTPEDERKQHENHTVEIKKLIYKSILANM